MCHKVSVEAFEAAGDADRYPRQGEAWQPLKLYYDRTLSAGRVTALHEAMLAEGRQSPFAEWFVPRSGRQRPRWPERTVTTRVECGDWFEVRDRALLAHATQIDPQGWFFGIPREVQRRVWPTEEFELVRSLVETPATEDDLFAGLRDRVEV
jgi:mycothiol S-conjugate amidase